MSTKQKILTLAQRVEVIKKNESGMSCRKIAEEMVVGKTHLDVASVSAFVTSNCP